MKNDLNDLFITRIETDTANNPLYSEMISETDHEQVLLNILKYSYKRWKNIRVSTPLNLSTALTLSPFTVVIPIGYNKRNK